MLLGKSIDIAAELLLLGRGGREMQLHEPEMDLVIIEQPAVGIEHKQGPQPRGAVYGAASAVGGYCLEGVEWDD